MLEVEEECVPYKAEPSFINILVRETINYILAKIYDQHKLKPSNLIFKPFISKLNTESTSFFNIKYYKQTGACIMGGPLWEVTKETKII